MKRNVKAHAARLDIGFLERPVVEETICLLDGRQGMQGANLFRREGPFSNREERVAPISRFHIDTDGLVT